MPKSVAFLRAINVGGRVVPMERLRELFVSAGFANVETFIASGNVIFDSRPSKTLERTIETMLHDALGYEVATFVRTLGEVQTIASRLGDEPLFVGFLRELPAAAVQKNLQEAAAGEPDQFTFAGRELYWRVPNGRSSESKFSGPLLEKLLGMPTTVRNANTVRKLAAKYAR